MLETLRKGAKTWVAAIFIGLLVLSFAVWGIADIFGGYGTRTVATIADKDITAQDFQTAYRNELQSLSARFGRPITPDMAQLFGVEQRVLARMVTSAVVDTHAERLGLGIADQTVLRLIQADPSFQSSDGSFNQLIFRQRLAQAGISEAAYVEDRRGALLRAQIAGAFTEELTPPTVFVDASNDYQNEKRTIAHVTIGLEKAGDVPAPDDAAIKAYYDENPQEFTAPEYRKVELLSVTPEALAATVEVSDEDVEQDYEAHRSRHTTPARRRIQQISFPDEATARTALEAIRGGQDFVDAAKLAGQTASDIDLGIQSIDQLADPVVALAAFALGEGEVSEPIKGTFTTVLLRASEITEEVVRPLEEVRDEIRTQIARDRAVSAVADLYDAVEDDRAASMSFAEIAAKHSLAHRVIEAIDASGKATDGTDVGELPSTNELLGAIFSTEPGTEANALETTDQGFVWLDVVASTPAALKPFESVAEAARTAAERQKRLDALRDLSDRLLTQLNDGKPLGDFAKDLGLDVVTSEPLTRTGSAPGLPAAVVSQAFAMAEGRHGVAWTDARDGRVLFRLEAVTPAPAPADTARTAIVDDLTRQIADDLIGQYTNALRDHYKVEINQAALDYAAGRTQPPAGGGGLF
ncbi:MAG: peptidylprolyl isomerase [Rhizobiales bacterium]|nr:peptidylprolyl isomerase [Hyphomicrobiales bacterium]